MTRKTVMTLPAKTRALLREERHTDGLMATEMATLLNEKRDGVAAALRSMPDAYIDRWVKRPGSRSQYTAVWCIVTPPENCPRPTKENLDD